MEISANTSSSQLNTQLNADKAREDNRAQLETNQPTQQVEQQDRATTAEPVEQTQETAQAENRNNEQVVRQTEQVESTDETIGSQLDVRA